MIHSDTGGLLGLIVLVVGVAAFAALARGGVAAGRGFVAEIAIQMLAPC